MSKLSFTCFQTKGASTHIFRFPFIHNQARYSFLCSPLCCTYVLRKHNDAKVSYSWLRKEAESKIGSLISQRFCLPTACDHNLRRKKKPSSHQVQKSQGVSLHRRARSLYLKQCILWKTCDLRNEMGKPRGHDSEATWQIWGSIYLNRCFTSCFGILRV